MKQRTRTFAVNIVLFAKRLPTDPITAVIVRQLVRCGTGVGSNYRAACRGKSPRDFISKMKTAEEEADETAYWLEILVDAGATRPKDVGAFIDEADQLTRILVASIITARRNAKARRKAKSKSPSIVNQ